MANPVHEQNRRSWNAIIPVHNSHKRDQAGFFRDGGSTLYPEELELLGDIEGKRLVHLQCNCGQDSLSLAQRGAEVLGVDISDAAIEFAEGLSRDAEIPARFIRQDLLEWFETTEERFELGFATYGTIGWLEDLDAWARGVARVLEPGGRLVLLEFHPLVWSFGPEPDSYFLEGRIDEAGGVGDYVGQSKLLAPSGFLEGEQDFENPEPAHSYQWTVAMILQAVLDAGLMLEKVREYPYSNGCRLFEGMRPLPGRRWEMPEGQVAMPLMFGLAARKPS